MPTFLSALNNANNVCLLGPNMDLDDRRVGVRGR